jgi:hypothetical protein
MYTRISEYLEECKCGAYIPSTSPKCGVYVPSTSPKCGVYIPPTSRKYGVYIPPTSRKCDVFYAVCTVLQLLGNAMCFMRCVQLYTPHCRVVGGTYSPHFGLVGGMYTPHFREVGGLYTPHKAHCIPEKLEDCTHRINFCNVVV